MFCGMLGRLDGRARGFLRDFRKRQENFNFALILRRLRSLKVLVIGEAIIDRYSMCRVLGKSSKSPTLNSRFIENMNFAGGALAIANHISGFVDEVRVVTVVGSDGGIEIVKPEMAANVRCEEVVRNFSVTTTKQRFVEYPSLVKMFEVSFLDDQPLDKETSRRLLPRLEPQLEWAEVVLIADFGHGMLTPDILEHIIQHVRRKMVFWAVNVQTNSANYGFNLATKYREEDYISLDENEIRLAMGSRHGKINELLPSFSRKVECSSILLTLGREGNVYFSGETFFPVPAFSDNHVIDTLGAGDAVFAITSLVASTYPPNREIIPFVGSSVGSLAVEILGNSRPIQPQVLNEFMEALLSEE